MKTVARHVLGSWFAILLAALVVSFVAVECFAEVIVQGTEDQREEIADWLSDSLGADVEIDSNGKMSIESGGNAAATRLRGMIADRVSVTLEIVENSSRVLFGEWQPSVNQPTNGKQTIDISDFRNLGNTRESYGWTPDVLLMHEITEVYAGKKYGLSCRRAHFGYGLAAERELMAVYGTSRYLFPYPSDPTNPWRAYFYRPPYYYIKINRPRGSDPSHVVIRFDLRNHAIQWMREKTPCRFVIRDLIAISDPDPQVWLYQIDSESNRELVGAIDAHDSLPAGAEFGPNSHLYVLESSGGEIREYSLDGELVNTFYHDLLIDPTDIAIDDVSGDLFVSAASYVLQFSDEGHFQGLFRPGTGDFQPSSVTTYRETPMIGIGGDPDIYDLFVSDLATNQIYRFDVAEDADSGSYQTAFGENVLEGPVGVTTDRWGYVWAASSETGRVHQFTTDGELQLHNGSCTFASVSASYWPIEDLEVTDAGGVYVVTGTSPHAVVLYFDENGELVDSFGDSELQCPTSIDTCVELDLDNLIPYEIDAE